MVKHIEVLTEEDGLNWCTYMGYEFLGIEPDSLNRLILTYEDGTLSREEEEYYLRKMEREEEKWVIYSEDGCNSTLYKSEKGYVFRVADAKRYNKANAQRVAVMMTKNSRVGRVWKVLKVK